jgi:hypothetical protein
MSSRFLFSKVAIARLLQHEVVKPVHGQLDVGAKAKLSSEASRFHPRQGSLKGQLLLRRQCKNVYGVELDEVHIDAMESFRAFFFAL